MFLVPDSVISVVAAVVEEVPKEMEPENPEDETRRNLAFLLEKVEGCSVSVHYSDSVNMDFQELLFILFKILHRYRIKCTNVRIFWGHFQHL